MIVKPCADNDASVDCCSLDCSKNTSDIIDDLLLTAQKVVAGSAFVSKRHDDNCLEYTIEIFEKKWTVFIQYALCADSASSLGEEISCGEDVSKEKPKFKPIDSHLQKLEAKTNDFFATVRNASSSFDQAKQKQPDKRSQCRFGHGTSSLPLETSPVFGLPVSAQRKDGTERTSSGSESSKRKAIFPKGTDRPFFTYSKRKDFVPRAFRNGSKSVSAFGKSSDDKIRTSLNEDPSVQDVPANTFSKNVSSEESYWNFSNADNQLCVSKANRSPPFCDKPRKPGPFKAAIKSEAFAEDDFIRMPIAPQLGTDRGPLLKLDKEIELIFHKKNCETVTVDEAHEREEDFKEIVWLPVETILDENNIENDFVSVDLSSRFKKTEPKQEIVDLNFPAAYDDADTLQNCGKLYKCKYCEKTFEYLALKWQHEIVHRPYSCNYCERTFVHLTQKLQHEKIHIYGNPYPCNFCEKSFGSIRQKKQHERIHTDERPYSCKYCTKTFTHASRRAGHEIIHTGERPYTCGFCGKSFNTKNSKHRHQRVHTGEKPYSCSHCDKRFANIGNKNKHERLHLKWETQIVM